jgi:hypothetical protein
MPFACAVLTSTSAAAQSLFQLTAQGTSCKALTDGSLFCRYVVGKDLEFSITSVGAPDAGISFLRSNFKRGDYFARFGVAHGCVVVAEGMAAPSRSVPYGLCVCLAKDRPHLQDLGRVRCRKVELPKKQPSCSTPSCRLFGTRWSCHRYG